MSEVLAVSLRAMHQDMGRVEQIAANMANMSTPGYKKQVVAALQFGDLLPADQALPSSGQVKGRLLESGLMALTDTHPGTYRTTSSPLDFALEGDGFFEVATADGPTYTRKGDFKIDARGRLTTQDGAPVMGKSGEIFFTTATPSVDAQGNMTEAGMAGGPTRIPVGQMKVVKFEQQERLTPIGNGLYKSDAAPIPVPDGEFRVRQGSLENANVGSLQEMMQLMQTMRHFESMQKATVGYEEMIGSAIKKLGDM